MLVATHLDQLREAISHARRDGQTVGLVPTMGALHDGHLALVDRAREENGFVVVTVFVNPTQFRPGEDLDRYPRQIEKDVELAAAHGAAVVFAPASDEVYESGHATTVTVAGVSETLCGDPARRGREHFDGVATVVLKLLNMVQPDRAYFGQKDAQQLAVIRRMAADLNVPAEIVGCATVREADGLAMSSRNAYLDAGQRQRATALWRALNAARHAVSAGERDPRAVIAAAEPVLAGLDAVEYFELVDPATMAAVERIDGPVLATLAARCGDTRLIDNLLLEPALAPVAEVFSAGPAQQQENHHIPQGAAA